MDNEFKIPTFEPKLKIPTKKGNDANESKEVSAAPLAVTASKEAETAKVKLDLPKISLKCPYVEPKWSEAPDSSLVYNFEVLKGGQIVENIRNLQSKAYWAIGKFPDNHIVMAHPTVSRYHAVLQYRPEISSKDDSSDSDDDNDNDNGTESSTPKPNVDKGWYLYDLSSTHGSFVNKMKVPPKTYIRIRVGYMLKFGASTRNYIFQGPGFDEEAESELTITEMKELRLKKQKEQQEKLMEEEKRQEEQGISWGMADDADEETDLSHNPFATTNNEELFLPDPKKTLRGFFEREGLNLDYKVDELSSGTYICRIELPITDSMGRSIIAEFTHKGKKKECVAQCALEACRILDRNGLLRQANHEPRKRKIESSDDDDDDEFYDRTTEAEEKRRRKAGAEESVSLSYEQLLTEEKKLQTQLLETEKRIERYQQLEKATKEKEAMDVDDLDDFMSGLSNEKQMDKADVRKCRFELQRIKTDIQKVQRLINIAKPIELPQFKADASTSDGSQAKRKLPLFGKKKAFGFDKLKLQVATKKGVTSDENTVSQSESVEEFDEDEDKNVNEAKSSNLNEVGVEYVTPEATPIPVASKVVSGCDETMVDSTSEPSIEQTEAEANPVSISKDIKNHEKLSTKSDESRTDDTITSSTEELVVQSSSAGPSSSNKNKNRQRNKVRNQIDIDDTEEEANPQKYSGWIPPENQTGDGVTALNSKYGY